MNLRATALLLLLLPLTAGASQVPAEAQWLGLPQSAAGTPLRLEIVSSTAAGVHLALDCSGLYVREEVQDGQTRTRVIVPPEWDHRLGWTHDAGRPELPVLNRLLALPPDRGAEIVITQVEYQAFPCDRPWLAEAEAGFPARLADSQGQFPAAWAEAGTPGILKDYRVVPVRIHPVRWDADRRQLLVATRLEVEVRTTRPSDDNVKTFTAAPSQAFLPVYQAAIDNFDQVALAGPVQGNGGRGKYMIIVHENFVSNAFLQNFIQWKSQLGYGVRVWTYPYGLDEGTLKIMIKSEIILEYFAGDSPLEYVLLIGDADVNDLIKLPAYTIYRPEGAPIPDPTDHPYAMLEGSDYYPDLMIGRISVDSDVELATVMNKTLSYQKTPSMYQTAWFKRALVAAGNFSDSGPVLTPVWTSLWLVDKLYDYGYNQVDTVFYWGSGSLGTAEIRNSINAGVSLIGYRGWGNANGWQYPYFGLTDLQSLTNGPKMAVMASIVCATGNFKGTVDPCFGEAWVRLGSPNDPKGGVAFYGPSDLHTNTKWNNAMYAGFYEGLLEENLYRLGQAALRGKMELDYGFPGNPEGYTNFYFHTYNILGDPELPMWTDVPATISLNVPFSVSPGLQEVTATVTRSDGSLLGGAYVAFYKENEVLTGGLTGPDGKITLPVQPASSGALTVTATRQNCKPAQVNITVQPAALALGLNGYSVDGDGAAQAGETVDLALVIKNFDGAAGVSSVTAQLAESDPYASLASTSYNLGSINANGEAAAHFTLTLAANTPNSHEVEFTLNLTAATGTAEAKFTLPVGGLQLVPAGYVIESGALAPGSTAQVRLRLCNAGTIPAQSLTGALSSYSGAVTVPGNQAGFPLLPPNQPALSNTAYTVSVAPTAGNGQQVILHLALAGAGGFTQEVNFPVQLGSPATTDPLGPDSYGYYIYDDTDQAYAAAPVFDWIELDPLFATLPGYLPGATLTSLHDDDSHVLSLPFTFTYYGEEYDQITVCSNGWICMGETWMADFRNWNLPSALGPPALVAPFWDDLQPNPNLDTLIRVFTYHDAAAGQFVVEWSRTVNDYLYETPANWKEETFEILLRNPSQHATPTGDGEIIFQYLVVYNVDDKENFATVGMEDEAHRRGLQYAYSNTYPSTAAPLADGRAVKITTDPPTPAPAAAAPEPVSGLRFEAPRPNPANPGTVLLFELPHSGSARMDLYDTQGRRAATLLNGELAAGAHTLALHGDRLSSGLYFAVLRFDESVLTQKILILK
ncbi:MAG: T9SS C-terminal target domain-containing protein [Candidatus Zixiibacteriota bacterium]|nr:MAG: T9SS C-terminal target domain-containing protein [candidate division Zixibacteria bacterium]